jgi:hypothetical protein
MDRAFANEIIPVFNGNEADLSRFISMVEQVKTEYESADETRILLKTIISKLRGPAFELTLLKNHVSWEELRADLQARFLPTKTLSQLQLEVANIRLKGSIPEFIDKLSMLLQSMNQAVAATVNATAQVAFKAHNEKLVLKAFISDVNPQHRTLLLARNPTFTQATEIVEEAESYSVTVSHSQSFTGDSRPPQSRNTNFYRSPGFRENQNQFKSEPGTFCTYCKTPGHSITNCPNPNCAVSQTNLLSQPSPYNGNRSPSQQNDFNRPNNYYNQNRPSNQFQNRPSNQFQNRPSNQFQNRPTNPSQDRPQNQYRGPNQNQNYRQNDQGLNPISPDHDLIRDVLTQMMQSGEFSATTLNNQAPLSQNQGSGNDSGTAQSGTAGASL